MIFEEFFKKKKINLVTFEQGEPALFSEFKIHFEQMGEKSFDHTKKYWFNKLRLRFPAPPEVKTEKVAIENPLAQQTITEALIESASPSPNVGFKPKFRAGVTKPIESTPDTETAPTSKKSTENTEQAAPLPNIGFKPKFKAGVTKPAEAVPQPKEDTSSVEPAINTEQSTRPPNVGFKPRFKAGVTKPAEAAPPKENLPNTESEAKTEPATPPSNIGFKPRFKAGVTKPAAPAQGQTEDPKEEE